MQREVHFAGLIFKERKESTAEHAAFARVLEGAVALDNPPVIHSGGYTLYRCRVYSSAGGRVILDIHKGDRRMSFGLQTSNEDEARSLRDTHFVKFWLQRMGIVSDSSLDAVTIGVFSRNKRDPERMKGVYSIPQ